jgi:hypothetical protein
MNQILTTFIGIVTHMHDQLMFPPDDAFAPPGEPDPLPRHYSRAIAVNGRFGARLGGHAIPPHLQLLHIAEEFIADPPPGTKICGLEEVAAEYPRYWLMEGVRLYIPHATQGLQRTDSHRSVPSLKDSVEELSLDLDPRVVLHGAAACQFEIFAGTLDAYRVPESNNAVHVKLTVDTPDKMQLVVTRIWDRTSTRITLQNGADGRPPHLWILNVGKDTDADADFLLHYYTTTWTPPAGTMPRLRDIETIRTWCDDDDLAGLPDPPAGVTLGCSNSNYP